MTSANAQPIGLIGLGLMGMAMAERWLAAGFQVRGADLDPSRVTAFAALGGQPMTTAGEVVAQCEQVVLSLPDDSVVRCVLEQVRGQFRATSTLIDTSTGDPQHAAQLGKELSAQQVTYLDATVSGSSAQVRSGDVLIMVGGDANAFARVLPTLEAVSTNIVHTGPCGSGAQLKLVTNLVLGLNRAALAEGLAFAQSLGLDAKQSLQVLRSSMAYSRIMDTKGEKMIARDFEPQARLSQHLKDVRLMLRSAGESGATLPLTDVHRQLLEAAEAAGFGSADNSAIIEVFLRAPANEPQQATDRAESEATRHGY
jgi:3-hydroxyisobutyrate dehydrogenase-like beta-hydroxyacid dehydrogenase